MDEYDILNYLTRRAIYEQLRNGLWYGYIPGFVHSATAITEAACKEKLRDILKRWLLTRQ